MTTHTIAKLSKFFSTLDADLSHDLAFALADRIGITYEAIVAQYEAWQIDCLTSPASASPIGKNA